MQNDSTVSEAKTKRRPLRTAQYGEKAFQRLRKAILTGEFAEGETLKEARIAREWKIGRTPIRQAVRRAAEYGYVTLRPNKAPIVRLLSPEDIENIYSMREELESFALKRSWKNIATLDVQRVRQIAEDVETAASLEARLQKQFYLDQELHGLWLSECNNPWLLEAMERLFIYRPNQIAILRKHPQLVESGFRDHKTIIQALEKRDAKSTARLLRKHIRDSGAGLLAFITKQSLNSLR